MRTMEEIYFEGNCTLEEYNRYFNNSRYYIEEGKIFEIGVGFIDPETGIGDDYIVCHSIKF